MASLICNKACGRCCMLRFKCSKLYPHVCVSVFNSDTGGFYVLIWLDVSLLFQLMKLSSVRPPSAGAASTLAETCACGARDSALGGQRGGSAPRTSLCAGGVTESVVISTASTSVPALIARVVTRCKRTGTRGARGVPPERGRSCPIQRLCGCCVRSSTRLPWTVPLLRDHRQ